MDERLGAPRDQDAPDDAGEDLWSEALWSAGLIGSVLVVIALLAQFA